MSYNKISTVLFSLILFSSLLLGQDDIIINKKIVLSGGISLPMGEYAETEGEKGGYGLLGFTGRFDFSSLASNNLYWTSSLALSINATDETEMDKQVKAALGSTVSATTESYTSIWALTGISFETPMAPNSHLHGILQIGILNSLFPDIKLTGPGGSVTQTTESSLAFAYSLGAGLQINNINISVRYMAGEPEYKQTASMGGSTSTSTTVKMPTNLLAISAGIVF